jgi:uncharacterized protein (DUF2164 family)
VDVTQISNEKRERIVAKLQAYMVENLEFEIEQFDAEFLLQFFIDEIGVLFYNQGILDAQAKLDQVIDSLKESISELERAVPD